MLLTGVTGARRSEVLGLSWEDVDLAAGTIFIRRGVQRIPRSENAIGAGFTPLKTKRARRLVALPAFALQRLRRHRREQLERRGTLGTAWSDPIDDGGEPIALVCERGDGLFLHPDAYTHAFKRLVRATGLHPSTRLHDVRHAVATELGRRGVHSVIVSAMLGHASPAFTAAVYQHEWQEGPSRQRPRSKPRSLPVGRWQSVDTDRLRARNGRGLGRELAGHGRGAGWTRTSDQRIMSPPL